MHVRDELYVYACEGRVDISLFMHVRDELTDPYLSVADKLFSISLVFQCSQLFSIQLYRTDK